MSYPLYLLHQVNGAVLMGGLVNLGMSETTALLAAVAFAISASWFISTALEPPLQRFTKRAVTSMRSYAEHNATRLAALYRSPLS
jgi:peptidoglycan/LPS O-acetylase OafA/YrhL